ncbi:hypothetical protein [Leuconostoc mesenteroides]|uniref:hypothetical protein n=1 Tax=Leuconostoc mesenteroides TaxID=1245 RepID=UPI00235EE122|nr:hypothetical protein [Leuconostoc mesenteroides]
MTRYIERLNRVYAIQNNGDYAGKIIPFLRENGIPFEYKESFLEGRHIDVNVHGELTAFNSGEYLVAGIAGVSIMSPEKFKREFEEDVDLHKHIADLEAKLSKVITEIDKLKTTIKAERTLTDNKITDAIIKWTVNGK